MLPFPLLGFDTDNGGEFLNAELVAYCAAEGITFTRGRVGKKHTLADRGGAIEDDQASEEQPPRAR